MLWNDWKMRGEGSEKRTMSQSLQARLLLHRHRKAQSSFSWMGMEKRWRWDGAGKRGEGKSVKCWVELLGVWDRGLGWECG